MGWPLSRACKEVTWSAQYCVLLFMHLSSGVCVEEHIFTLNIVRFIYFHAKHQKPEMANDDRHKSLHFTIDNHYHAFIHVERSTHNIPYATTHCHPIDEKKPSTVISYITNCFFSFLLTAVIVLFFFFDFIVKLLHFFRVLLL